MRHSTLWLDAHAFAYMSPYWLVNVTIGSYLRDHTSDILKPSFILKYKWLCHKTIVYYVKDKWLCHKNLSFTVFGYYKCWIYMYCESAHEQGVCICIFVFSLLFLVLKMTTLLCLSPKITFNKSYWFYLQSPPVWFWCDI